MIHADRSAVRTKRSAPAGVAGRGGAASGAGAHPPPGEGEERSGGADQGDERSAGGSRADGPEGREEDHPEAGGEGTEAESSPAFI